MGLLLLHTSIPWPMLSFAAVLTVAEDAYARSSGGYSRAGGSSSSRTPSFGSSSRSSSSYSRTPSTSGGYSRPSSSPSRSSSYGSSSSGSSSSGSWWGGGSRSGGTSFDNSYSRRQSSDALTRMRQQQDQIRRQRDDTPSSPATTAGSRTSSGSGWSWGTGSSRSSSSVPANRPSQSRTSQSTGGWYRDQGWAPPPGYGVGPARFGIWDGMFLWFLLSNLNRPGSTDFFRAHRDDPGYREWRQEADRQARDNPQMRGQLDQLDHSLADSVGQPPDPNYLPPDIPSDVALAPIADARTPSTGDDSGGGSGIVSVLILGGIVLFIFLAWRRRRPAPSAAGGKDMGTIGSAAGMLRHKLSGESYTPEHFRVGMTVTADTTPFLLGAGTLKARAPAVEGRGLVSVEAVGRIENGAAVRLYLPEDRSFYELYQGRPGEIDGGRFFSLVDEVVPADEDEWGVWLHPQEGMIGWTQFQTKDGKLYDRAWSPGGGMVPPRQLDEWVETVQGTRLVRHQAMLYAAPTGIAAPGPETEYILVSTVEDDGRAWVEIRAGIDVNTAALSIA